MVQAVHRQAEAGREPLTRARILKRALELLDQDGLEALSMRRLAGDLGVSPMALYNHVPNKEALHEGITELVLGEIDISSVASGDHWTDGIKAAVSSFRDVLLRHPNAIQLIQTKPITTPEGFRPIEASLAAIRRAGFDPETAVHVHWAIVGFAMGHVSSQVSNPLQDPEILEQSIEVRRQIFTPEEFPALSESMPYALECDFDAAFDLGLDALLQGLDARLQS
jgi:AcrR family transcriptional regulator